MEELGATVSTTKLYEWFGIPRRIAYYQPHRSKPKVQERFAQTIKVLIEENPSFGYQTAAHLLGFNKNIVQHVFQLIGWQVKKRSVGFRSPDQALPSVVQ